jgi:hypothetical protein
MLPLSEKMNFKMSKNLEKNMHMYISIFYVVTQSFVKTDILCALCKKDKNMHREKAYFSTKIYHFYIDHIKSRFFVETIL